MAEIEVMDKKEEKAKPQHQQAQHQQPQQQAQHQPATGKTVVAAGKSITSKRGVLKPGDEVRAEYLAGGENSLKILISKGFCVKV